MKLYAVIGSFSYEGFDNPVGIFDTFEAAVVARDAAIERYGDVDIFEYDLNAVDGGFQC